jgi:hypothetical protein
LAWRKKKRKKRNAISGIALHPHARNRAHKVRGTDVIGRWRHDGGKKVLIPSWLLLLLCHLFLLLLLLLTSIAGFCVWTLASSWRRLSQMTASAAVYVAAITQLFAVLVQK